MHNGQRNKPLNKRQIEAKKIISRRRYIIEQCFGLAKQVVAIAKANYIGTKMVNALVIMKSICTNLLKAANKVFFTIRNREKTQEKSHDLPLN